MISYIHRLMFGPQTTPAKIDLASFGITDCPSCHSHLRSGFALSLMSHLSKVHKMGENEAIETAIRMLELLKAEKQRVKKAAS